MGNDVAEVEQDPATLGPTFAPQRLGPGFDHLVFDLARDRLHVALIAPGDEVEDVGQRKRTRDVESDGVDPLLRVSGEGCHGEKLAGAHSCSHRVLRGEGIGEKIGTNQKMFIVIAATSRPATITAMVAAAMTRAVRARVPLGFWVWVTPWPEL